MIERIRTRLHPVVQLAGSGNTNKLYPRGPPQEIRSEGTLRAHTSSGAESEAPRDNSNPRGQSLRSAARNRRRTFDAPCSAIQGRRHMGSPGQLPTRSATASHALGHLRAL